MAGTIAPIAALTTDDLGPINTIVAIVLPVTSALIAAVRMATRKNTLPQFEADDFVFGIGLMFAVLASILSHLCVRAGLGRHQATLSEDRVVVYFKYFWTTQILNVIALASAKTSLVLLFKRIAPIQIEPLLTFRWLTFMVIVYALICLSTIAFQCQLPQPWILSPTKCSTHGTVYYATTSLNILTDAVLALWIFPVIRRLKMEIQTKTVVMSVFGSRLLVCLADVGRIIVIHEALQSEDQTRSQLLWAIMDQIVVHLSINHATLPRIQTFLSHLQIGSSSSKATGAHSSSNRGKTQSSSVAYVTHTSGSKIGQQSTKMLNVVCKKFKVGLAKAPSISEQPLRYEQQEDIELSTMVHAGKSALREGGAHEGPSATALISSEVVHEEEGSSQVDGVRVQKDIYIAYDQI